MYAARHLQHAKARRDSQQIHRQLSLLPKAQPQPQHGVEHGARHALNDIRQAGHGDAANFPSNTFTGPSHE
jgi:hypothetical protein